VNPTPPWTFVVFLCDNSLSHGCFRRRA
jgi:hypothetical protein